METKVAKSVSTPAPGPRSPISEEEDVDDLIKSLINDKILDDEDEEQIAKAKEDGNCEDDDIDLNRLSKLEAEIDGKFVNKDSTPKEGTEVDGDEVF